jgi:hypothetical protein
LRTLRELAAQPAVASSARVAASFAVWLARLEELALKEQL